MCEGYTDEGLVGRLKDVPMIRVEVLKFEGSAARTGHCDFFDFSKQKEAARETANSIF